MADPLPLPVLLVEAEAGSYCDAETGVCAAPAAPPAAPVPDEPDAEIADV